MSGRRCLPYKRIALDETRFGYLGKVGVHEVMRLWGFSRSKEGYLGYGDNWGEEQTTPVVQLLKFERFPCPDHDRCSSTGPQVCLSLLR